MSCASAPSVSCSSQVGRSRTWPVISIHKEALLHWVRQTEADTGRRRDLLTTTSAMS
jgi:hypothetical protein